MSWLDWVVFILSSFCLSISLSTLFLLPEFSLYMLNIIIIVWANFALGSNSVKGKDRPNILYEEIRTSEDDQPRNG